MNRSLLTVFVVFIPFLLVVALAAGMPALPPAKGPSADRPTTTPAPPTVIKGTLGYRGLVVFAADARVTVQLLDISQGDGTEVVLGEQVIATAGREVPLEFEVGYDPASIMPNGMYVVVGSMVVDGELVYRTTTTKGVITRGQPTTVQLVLDRVGSWSSLDLAVSSGLLSRHSY
jgi:putative lipoprotein